MIEKYEEEKIIVECTWWLLWFLLKLRAWRVLQVGWVWQRIEPILKKVFFFCWIWLILILQLQFCRRCREWMSSWCSWLSWRHQCRGVPAWAPCRCRWRRSQLFFFLLFCQRVIWLSWLRLVSFPFRILSTIQIVWNIKEILSNTNLFIIWLAQI